MPRRPPERLCASCGTALDAHRKRFCDECAAQHARLHKRRTTGYICIDAPDRLWLNGWFSSEDMQQTLKAGTWPVGMVFEHLSRNSHGRCVRVVMPVVCQQIRVLGDEPPPEFPPQRLIEIREEAQVAHE